MDLDYEINEIQISFIFECVHEAILSQCVLDAIRVWQEDLFQSLQLDNLQDTF